MDSLCREHIEISGGNPLHGNVRVHGAKNAVLPILAATVLNGTENVIRECPNLSDVKATLKILKALGCKVQYENGTAYIQSASLTEAAVPFEQMREMRSSVIFLGALAARCGEAHMCLPGGCELGPRPIDLHIAALEALGMEVFCDGSCLHCYAKNPHPADVILAFPSVGATENAVLAATAMEGTTRIIGAAREPEIEDLLSFLRKIGIGAFSDGNGTVFVHGNKSLHAAEHEVIPDRILVTTLMACAVSAGGDIVMEHACPGHIQAVLEAFQKLGAEISTTMDTVRIKAPDKVKGNICVETAPYPGFPTDAQSVFMAALLKAEGESRIRENIFEARFRTVPEFRKMGAKLDVDANEAVIYGVDALHGADLVASDLRAGAALCAAATGADGVSRIYGTHHIKRGYADLVGMLSRLGAQIVEKG